MWEVQIYFCESVFQTIHFNEQLFSVIQILLITMYSIADINLNILLFISEKLWLLNAYRILNYFNCNLLQK